MRRSPPASLHRLADLSRTPEGLSEAHLLARYRAAKLLAEAHGLPVSSFLADWFPCHLSRFEDLDRSQSSPAGEEAEYPFTLGYTDGQGTRHRVVVRNSDEADEAFDEMFKSSPLGEAIPYSVD